MGPLFLLSTVVCKSTWLLYATFETLLWLPGVSGGQKYQPHAPWGSIQGRGDLWCEPLKGSCNCDET